jgi:hypothetical protein
MTINGMKSRPGDGIFANNQTQQMRRLYYIECEFQGKFLPLSENGSPRLFGSAQERDQVMSDLSKKYAITPATARIKSA